MLSNLGSYVLLEWNFLIIILELNFLTLSLSHVHTIYCADYSLWVYII